MISLPWVHVQASPDERKQGLADRQFDFTVWGAGVLGAGCLGEGYDMMQQSVGPQPADVSNPWRRQASPAATVS